MTVTIPVGVSPTGVAVSPDGSRVYVTNQGDGIGPSTVSVIDTKTNTVTANVRVGVLPTFVAVTSDSSKVYVTNQSSGTVSVINATTNTVIATIPVGPPPQHRPKRCRSDPGRQQGLRRDPNPRQCVSDRHGDKHSEHDRRRC